MASLWTLRIIHHAQDHREHVRNEQHIQWLVSSFQQDPDVVSVAVTTLEDEGEGIVQANLTIQFADGANGPRRRSLRREHLVHGVDLPSRWEILFDEGDFLAPDSSSGV